MLVRIGNREAGTALIRMHLQKQSNIGLHCLSRPLWQATSVQNFRTSTVNILKKAQIYACHSEVKIAQILTIKLSTCLYHVLSTQKNCLIQTVLMRQQIIKFIW